MMIFLAESKFTLTLRYILFSIVFLAPQSISEAAGSDLSGIWRGQLLDGESSIELIFHIEATADGSWTGTVDTPAQSSFGLPLSGVSISEENSVLISVAATGGLYEANLNGSGDELEGVWKQRGSELKLLCSREPALPQIPEKLAASLVGTWQGTLKVGAIELRILIDLSRQENGKIGGFMVSPDQSPAQLRVTRLDFLDDAGIRISVGELFISYLVDFSEDGKKLTGSMLQGRGKFDIELTRENEVIELLRPQTPVPPFPYKMEEVSYSNPATSIVHSGTLTIPAGEGPFPAVLLISGSGAQNRDEELFQHRPFHVIADHLSRNGVAVLRVDDRGVGGTTTDDNPKDDTTLDHVGDALRGFRFLQGRAEIDAKRVGLIGHSEGGVIAPLAAQDEDEVAFIVMLAGTGVRGDRLLLSQAELISKVEEISEEELQAGLALNRKLFDVVLQEQLSSTEQRDLFSEILEEQEELSPAERDSILQQMSNQWIQWFIRFDPTTSLEAVQVPVLAVNGSLDLQVPCKENLDAIAAALEKGGNSDFETVTFPDLNHLFQHCATGAPSEYGKIEETFAPEVLEKITSWINSRFGNDRDR